jgi:hypothetical protein
MPHGQGVRISWMDVSEPPLGEVPPPAAPPPAVVPHGPSMLAAAWLLTLATAAGGG